MVITAVVWIVKTAFRKPIPTALVVLAIVYGLPRLVSVETIASVLATLFVLACMVGSIRMEIRTRDKHTVNRPD